MLLGHSAAFNPVDHSILLERLENWVWIFVLNRFRSPRQELLVSIGNYRRVLTEGLLGKRLSVLATPTYLFPLSVCSDTGTFLAATEFKCDVISLATIFSYAIIHLMSIIIYLLLLLFYFFY
jgi:hypothetical protein